VTHKLPGGQFGIEKGFCVLGFQPPAQSVYRRSLP
jgi:hypothetical protein